MSGTREVAILLGLRNGATTLDDQLQSYLCQRHPAWHLIASDDGSTDATRRLLARFARDNPDRRITLTDGPQRGFAQNFLHLLRAAGPDVPFAAFSDQDDSWLPAKLSRGLAALGSAASSLPVLYCGRTWVCDTRLRPVARSPLFRRPPGFRNALVQSIAGGNTMMLNRAALDLAQAASVEPPEVMSHDWWLYQIVTGAGGRVIYDPVPMVLYRQHGQNLVGENGTAAARMARLARLLGGRFRAWNEVNIRALMHSRHRLTPENRALLDDFAAARDKPAAERLSGLIRTGLHRQTRAGDASLWCAAVLGLV